jgi:hypothetical protein
VSLQTEHPLSNRPRGPVHYRILRISSAQLDISETDETVLFCEALCASMSSLSCLSCFSQRSVGIDNNDASRVVNKIPKYRATSASHRATRTRTATLSEKVDLTTTIEKNEVVYSEKEVYDSDEEDEIIELDVEKEFHFETRLVRRGALPQKRPKKSKNKSMYLRLTTVAVLV